MQLLRELLTGRNVCLLLYKDKVFCSCGAVIDGDDDLDVENHVVTHEKHLETPDDFILKSREEIACTLRQLLATCVQEVSGERVPDNLVQVAVPGKTCFVVLDENELDSGHVKDIPCAYCSVRLANYTHIQEHMQAAHPKHWRPQACERILYSRKEQRQLDRQGWMLHYFCPIPACKYHVLQEQNCGRDSTNGRRYFGSIKLLKQHYLKVHAQKEILCENCTEKFASEQLLARHSKLCGARFPCLSCDASYASLEALQTHARRKGHSIRTPGRARIASRRYDPTKRDSILNVGTDGARVGLRRIAPRPSSVQMNAAIALSELSFEKRFILSKSNMANQTDFVLLPKGSLTARCAATSATTQTASSPSPSPRKRTTQTQTKFRSPPKRRRRTTARLDLGFGDDTLSANNGSPSTLVAVDRPLWTASSTQTSPVDRVFKNDVFMDQQDAEALFRPRLGDIEQFSTETQTDHELEKLVSGPYSGARPSNSTDLFVDSPCRVTEAETQFDLDDILCSNYTQTGFDQLLSSDLLSEDQTTSVATIETQTMWKDLDTSCLVTSHVETQTKDDIHS